MGAANKLTVREVAALDRPGRYGDGRGLWLQVSRWGTKAWIFRYTIAGRPREMGLGPVSLQRHDGGVSLAEAREARDRCQQQLRAGLDPIEARRERTAAMRAEAAKGITFRAAAEAYIAAHKAGWRNAKHAEQWTATLSTYAYPTIGQLSVAAIETGHVMKILEPIWSTKTETASRVRGRIERVLDWAAARGHRQGDNPARWRGHLDKLLPSRRAVRKVRNQPALSYDRAPVFMARLRAMTSLSARALEFTILTAARTGETIGATWVEIDLDRRLWTVPGERMKSGREHRVPLSDRAVELLRALPRERGNPHVFAGGRSGKGLSNMAMLQLVRGLDDGLTVHGFRSTFRDWAAERTNFAREVAEAALAHVVADKTEAAYRRGDALEKRRRLMEAWARFCAQPSAAGAVVPMQAAR